MGGIFAFGPLRSPARVGTHDLGVPSKQTEVNWWWQQLGASPAMGSQEFGPVVTPKNHQHGVCALTCTDNSFGVCFCKRLNMPMYIDTEGGCPV